MNEQVQQIAEHLTRLRDTLETTPEEVAKVCNLTTEQYLLLENDTVDISVSVLHQTSQVYDVELIMLMFGNKPKMSAYFITHNGRGVTVEHTKAYKHQSLTDDSIGHKAGPFLIVIYPKPEGEPMRPSSYPGQEYNMVLKERLLLQIDNKDLILEEGGSVYFNSELPHSMKALDGERVSFLTVIL